MCEEEKKGELILQIRKTASGMQCCLKIKPDDIPMLLDVLMKLETTLIHKLAEDIMGALRGGMRDNDSENQHGKI